jgi:hypothetical protein
MRYISRQQRENDRLCESVAKRFKLKKPLSFRASKIINANCSCVEDVKAWIRYGKSVLVLGRTRLPKSAMLSA